MEGAPSHIGLQPEIPVDHSVLYLRSGRRQLQTLTLSSLFTITTTVSRDELPGFSVKNEADLEASSPY